MSKLKDYLDNYWDYIGQYQGEPVVEIPDVGREDLAHLFAELAFTRGVEVGTERGIYAETLCQANPQLHLTCVDPYKAYHGYREHKSQRKIDGFFMEAQLRLAGHSVTFLRKFSTDAAADFKDGSLDFVYIDGNHSLLHVTQDLWHWVPKVRKGGIVAGHDYVKRVNPSYAMHVVPAIHAYVDAFRIKPLFILGTKMIKEGEVRDVPRSFMFTKE